MIRDDVRFICAQMTVGDVICLPLRHPVAPGTVRVERVDTDAWSGDAVFWYQVSAIRADGSPGWRYAGDVERVCALVVQIEGDPEIAYPLSRLDVLFIVDRLEPGQKVRLPVPHRGATATVLVRRLIQGPPITYWVALTRPGSTQADFYAVGDWVRLWTLWAELSH